MRETTLFQVTTRTVQRSDGYKDSVDCGPGDDEAWINVSNDGDLARNCESLHAG